MNIIGKKLRNVYNFKKGNLYLYDDLVIGEVDEGVHVSSETLISFFEFFHENYSKPFGYISFRKNSYSIDPQIYSMLPENNLLKGIAIVSNQKFSSLNAKVEKGLYKGRCELFTTIDAAVNWLDTIMPLQNENADISDNSTI
ncbi:hypothetical protein KORDIASMS9_04249 [Kordia sp. SMS9]|uniref:STAS/SEC14 domain-containing protein n=1 Tax=Kordia sp. SMS9 TaxID=2282170 RepID=UPI000E0DDEDD|nr:STAS/SEC14 domain-containing protein [Kordia sp. SMS9]AXG71988.1 hypothetical protein KORDIASMS9_04249 [Kordia sp. SMS9]